jgi:hypothetical protein
VVKRSISKTEIDRLQRVLNMRLEMVMDGDNRRGIKVAWCRTGRSGMTLWDTTGCWRGMPEKIEAACYDGLAEDEKKRLAALSPQTFPSRDAALAWAVERGVFKTPKIALPVYDRIKKAGKPEDAIEMAALWVAHINAVLVGERAATDTVDCGRMLAFAQSRHVDVVADDETGTDGAEPTPAGGEPALASAAPASDAPASTAPAETAPEGDPHAG